MLLVMFDAPLTATGGPVTVPRWRKLNEQLWYDDRRTTKSMT